MATVTKGKTFTSTETVTSDKLHQLVDSATVTSIATADLSDGAVTAAKLAANAVTTAKMADDNVTTDKIADDAVDKDKLGILTTKGDLLTYSSEPIRLAVGTDGQILKADSSQTGGVKWAAEVGKVVQVVNTTTKTVVSNATSTAMPYDNTIPQITEGDQYLSRTITPAASGNTLKIDVTLSYSVGTGGAKVTVALFDGSADAVAAICKGETDVHGDTANFTHYYTTSGTSELTFTVRCGSTGSTQRITMNGQNDGTQIYGGVASSSITITEISA